MASKTLMRLRPYRAADLDTLYQIDQACFPPGISYSRRELAGMIAYRGSKTWVAEGGEETAGAVEPIGFLVACREPQRAEHIITIDVVERWRRRKVGNALMDAVEEWARSENLDLIYLETAVDNLVAQNFYERRGYEKFRVIEKYYSDGTAAWVMVKRLNGIPRPRLGPEERRASAGRGRRVAGSRSRAKDCRCPSS